MYTHLKRVMKSAIKKKGITYRELGRNIGMSESGVKKLFQADDCSLDRIEKIARVLETDIGSLILQAQDEISSNEEIEISPKVQTFLQKNPLARDIYWLLLVEDLSPSDILAKYQISKNTLYKTLAALDRIGCIVWNENDRVITNKHRSFIVKSEGPLIQHWTHQFADSLLRDIATDSKHASDVFLTQRFLYLTKESVGEFRKRLQDVVTEFSTVSVRERKLGRARTKGIRLQLAFSSDSMVNELPQH